MFVFHCKTLPFLTKTIQGVYPTLMVKAYVWIFEMSSNAYKTDGSQGGQVSYAPDFHPGCLGSIPARGNLPKKTT